MIRRLRRRPVDDAGASLILALAFMTFLGLVVASLLSYSGTSLRSTKATEVKAGSTYDIDAALQAAINKVRTDATFANAPTEDCPPLSVTGPNTGAKVTVTCVGVRGTGAAGGLVEINDSNRPKNALLTLGSSGESGIVNNSSDLRVLGDVYVHSRPTSIEQSGDRITIDGALTARGSCDDTIVATAARCNTPAADPAGVDPRYNPPMVPLNYQPVPACSAGRVVKFQPGYYDDAAALTELTNGTGCSGKTLYFRPGTYFFDFHNGDAAPLPDSAHVWTINDANTDVVGGTPKGWSEATGNPTIPGACFSPLEPDPNPAANNGVQFVFGGDSRLDVQAGKVELCGRYSTGRPPIALYGARTGADPDPVSVIAMTDGTGVSTGPAFTPPAEITEINSVPATAAIDGTAGEVKSVVTVQVVPPSPVPAGSILTNAELVVVHRSDDPAGSTLKDLGVQFSSVVTGNSLGARDLTVVPGGPADAAYKADDIAVTGDLAGEIHRRGLTGLNVTYAATVAAGTATTENIDSIQLKLTYQPPAVRGQQEPLAGIPNCIGQVGGCAMITTHAGQSKLYVQGTTYAPLARLDVRLANVSSPVFSTGLIARALKVNITPSAAFGADPMIAVPDFAEGGPPKPLEVYFRAYTCPDGLACGNPAPAAPWRLAASARVRFVDPDIFAPTAPYDTVTVLGWTVRET